MALAICKKVHLYGFGIDTDPKIPYHYHDKVRTLQSQYSLSEQALLTFARNATPVLIVSSLHAVPCR